MLWVKFKDPNTGKLNVVSFGTEPSHVGEPSVEGCTAWDVWQPALDPFLATLIPGLLQASGGYHHLSPTTHWGPQQRGIWGQHDPPDMWGWAGGFSGTWTYKFNHLAGQCPIHSYLIIGYTSMTPWSIEKTKTNCFRIQITTAANQPTWGYNDPGLK